MRTVISVTLCLLFCASACAQSLHLKDALTSTELYEFRELAQGYRGRFHKTHGVKPNPGNDAPRTFEYTHVRRTNHGGKVDTPVIELVVCVEREGEFRAPTEQATNIPSFEELAKLDSIAKYEQVFGKFTGFTDDWGDRNAMHSSMGWLMFVPLDTGESRVVAVLLSTINRGNGWTLDGRQVREGIFRPTNSNPVYEKPEEPTHAPKSGLRNSSNGN